jgi:hypothetical protein
VIEGSGSGSRRPKTYGSDRSGSETLLYTIYISKERCVVCQVEGERATWHLVQLTGRRGEAAGPEKRRRRKEKGDEEEEVGDNAHMFASADSVTRWFGIFYICSIYYGKSED